MTKKQKKMLYRILAALALVLVLKLLPVSYTHLRAQRP